MIRFIVVVLAFFAAAPASRAGEYEHSHIGPSVLMATSAQAGVGVNDVNKTSAPQVGGQSCSKIIEADGMTADQRIRPVLTPVEINGVWVVALPQGFQDLMPGSNSPHHINILLTAIDQPAFPDWIKLKRAVFTQGEIADLTEGEVQQELLLGQDKDACGSVRSYVRPHGIEKNEKLLCADPQQVRLISSFSIAMHLIFEDSQGHSYEIVDEFCSFTPG